MIIERLRAYPEGQVRKDLLRFCLDACRVVHLLRSTELEEAGQAPARLRAKLQEATQDLLGTGLSEDAWDQVCLPIRLGGLGISDPYVVQPAARLAALATLELNGTRAVGVPASVLAHPSPDLQLKLQRLQAQLGPNMEPLATWVQDPQPLVSATQQHTTQKWWAEQVDEVRSQLVDTRGTVRDRVRRASQKGPVATAWLGALPSRTAQTEIPDAEFRLLLRWLLGLSILPTGVTFSKCPSVGS